MLSIDEALNFLDDWPVGELKPSIKGRFMPSIPRRLVQYWDQDPPEQITSLLTHNEKICKRMGLEHVIYDTTSARRFLTNHHSPEVKQLYERAPHPAIKSDLFRYAELAVNGGWYLDADMALRHNAPKIWTTSASCIVFKWNEEKRRNICNWFMGSQAGHLAMQHILKAAYNSLASSLESHSSERDIIRNALSIAGPGRLTVALADWFHTSSQDVLVATVPQAYRIVMNGPELLKQPLAYKSTARHWLVAGR